VCIKQSIISLQLQADLTGYSLWLIMMIWIWGNAVMLEKIDEFSCFVVVCAFWPIVLLHSIIGYWHNPVVHLSVSLSVCPSVCL